jgi:hypothetical protein
VVQQEDLNLVALAAEVRKTTVHNQVSSILNRPSAITTIAKKPCVATGYSSGQDKYSAIFSVLIPIGDND